MSEQKPYLSTRLLLREYRRIYEQKPLRLKKALGQHLLANSGMLNEIARVCQIIPASLVIEIGAGIGNLTQALLKYNPKRYIGIELDEDYKPLHESFFSGLPFVEYIYGDVLQLDFAALVRDFEDVVIVGNIPYQITSPLIIKLLLGDFHWSRIILTMQKEVAERLVAPPGTRKINSLSYKVKVFALPQLLFSMAASNFIPPPKVDSTVMKFTPRPEPLVPRKEVKKFFQLLNAAFAQRRKTILNTLASGQIANLNKDSLREILLQVGIDPMRRPETLSLEDYLRLFDFLQRQPQPNITS